MINTRRVVVNIILTAVFITAACLIIAPLIAEIQYGAAQKSGAEAKYRLAARLDPFNSEYLAGFGKFLYKLAYLKKAEGLYERAIRLNPYNAQYYLELGLVELAIYRNSRAAEGKTAMDSFKKALENDPNGFNVSYSVGYAGMAAWAALKKDEREWVLDRLKYSLEARNWYAKHIYPQVLRATKDFRYLKRVTPENLKGQAALYKFLADNNLWQFRGEQLRAVNFYRRKEEPEKLEQEISDKKKRVEEIKEIYRNKNEWRGKSANGGNEYKNGEMYWTGTMDAVVDAPKGAAIVKIQAKGAPAGGIYPYMIVELDGEEVGGAFVNNTGWKAYSFDINTDGGLKVLSVTFANDGGDKQKGEDRNLYVGTAVIENNG